MDPFASYTFYDNIQRPILGTENLYAKIHKLAFESRNPLSGQKALENLLESVLDGIDYQGSKRSKKLLYKAGIVELDRSNRVSTTWEMDDMLRHSVLLSEDNPGHAKPTVEGPVAEINLFSGVHDMPVVFTGERLGTYALRNGDRAVIVDTENIYAEIRALAQKRGGMRLLERMLDYLEQEITAEEMTRKIGREASKYLVNHNLAKRHHDGNLMINEPECDVIESSLIYHTNARGTTLNVCCPVTAIYMPATTEHVNIRRIPNLPRPEFPQ